MSAWRGPDPRDVQPGQYRRGAIMGLTMAESLVLVTFALLLLLALWKVESDARVASFSTVDGLGPDELAAAARLAGSDQLAALDVLVAGGADFRSTESTPGRREDWRLLPSEAQRQLADVAATLPSDVVEGLAAMLSSRDATDVQRLLRIDGRNLAQEIDTLTPADLSAAARLAEGGQLAAADTLAAEGLDLRAPEAREVWRLIDRDELMRVVEGLAELPSDAQAELADLVEVRDPEALEQLLLLSRRAAAEEVLSLPEADLEAALRLADSGQVDVLDHLVAEGADFRGPATPATMDDWVLVEDEERRRLVEAVEALPPDTAAAVATLLETQDVESVEAILALADGADEKAELEARLVGIGERLTDADEEARALVDDLRQTIGPLVARLGGTIEDDGALVLPDVVLFERGRAGLTPVMTDFLDGACGPWLSVLMSADAPVASALIEGHASSEWSTGASAEEAYLNNLALSQARSQAVLDACLRRVTDPAVSGWARTHLAAVGYSSARPILSDGAENADASRRVVFSLALDQAGLLDAVARDADVPQ